MRTAIFIVVAFCIVTPLYAADLPTGEKTPEGIACDALAAYVNTDSKAWLGTLVKPIYGPEGDKQYEEFKEEMVAGIDKMKEDKTYKPPRIVTCYKARRFTRNGPSSAAFAFFDFRDNMFVDLVLETPEGKKQNLRYHVLCDKDGKWYFDPRPDLSPLLSMGLNDESDSTEVLYEAK